MTEIMDLHTGMAPGWSQGCNRVGRIANIMNATTREPGSETQVHREFADAIRISMNIVGGDNAWDGLLCHAFIDG